MSGERIVVVDDERNMRETVQNILEEEGFRAVTAASGDEALRTLAQNDVSLVLIDARMPGMDGFELLDRARKQFPDVPVVMITAYATPKLAVRAIKGGAFDYIPKPFEPEELLATLEHA